MGNRSICIVTGAAGFLGSTLSGMLLSDGFRVRALVHNEKNAANVPAGAEIFVGDVLDPASLEALFAAPSDRSSVPAPSLPGENDPSFLFFHAAAHLSVTKKDPECYEATVTGTKNVIAACRAHGAKLIYFGSVDALENPGDGRLIAEPGRFHLEDPGSDYARSKADAGNLVLDAASEGLDACVILPSCLIGPGDRKGGFVTFMLKSFLKFRPRVSFRGGYDFADVRDAARGAMLASERGKCGGIYILSGKYISITKLFNGINELKGRKKISVTLPTGLLYAAAPFVNLANRLQGKRKILTANALKLLRTGAAFSHEKAARELGYTARPFEETLQDTLKDLESETKEDHHGNGPRSRT